MTVDGVDPQGGTQSAPQVKKMRSLAGKWTERAIFGRGGIDLRSRIVLLRTLDQKMEEMGEIPPAERDNVIKNFFNGTLPNNYGERFLKYPALLTFVFGVLLIVLLPRKIENAILSIHSSLGSPLAYVVLVGQWLAFYVAMSALAAGTVSLVAFLVYSKRLSKPRPLSLETPSAALSDLEQAAAPVINGNETAVEVVREAILQGEVIAETLASAGQDFGSLRAKKEWASEFTLAKCAVLSVRGEELDDNGLKTALFREIDGYVRSRAKLDPTAPQGFQRYGEIVRQYRETTYDFRHSVGLLFRERLDRTLSSLPETNGFRLDLVVSQGVVADYCWPLKNQTEASMFKTPAEVDAIIEARTDPAPKFAFLEAAKRASDELPRTLGRSPTFDEVMERTDALMREAGYTRRPDGT